MFRSGYFFAAVTGSDERVRRTVAIEVDSWLQQEETPAKLRRCGGTTDVNVNLITSQLFFARWIGLTLASFT